MKLLWAMLICSSLPILAAEPFTGTWKADMSKTKFSPKPQEVELANGTYKCMTCDPPIAIKADGTDQTVSGHPEFDILNVRVIDNHTIKSTFKKTGKIVLEQTITVAADARTATVSFTNNPPSSDKPVTGTFRLKRVGDSVGGMHAFSGAWVVEEGKFSDNALIVTFDETADSLKMTSPTGEHYDAKFDGKEYPYDGSPSFSAVVLKRISARVIEETDRHDGRTESTARMTVSPDGGSITVVARDRQGRVTTFVMNKQ